MHPADDYDSRGSLALWGWGNGALPNLDAREPIACSWLIHTTFTPIQVLLLQRYYVELKRHLTKRSDLGPKPQHANPTCMLINTRFLSHELDGGENQPRGVSLASHVFSTTPVEIKAGHACTTHGIRQKWTNSVRILHTAVLVS